MTFYIISYDQHRDKDYTPVWNALRKSGAKRILESVWLLEIGLTAAQVLDSLKQLTRNEDSLAIVELKTESDWAAYRTQPEGVTWLQAHILP